jgi:hypothetical protein
MRELIRYWTTGWPAENSVFGSGEELGRYFRTHLNLWLLSTLFWQDRGDEGQCPNFPLDSGKPEFDLVEP